MATTYQYYAWHDPALYHAQISGNSQHRNNPLHLALKGKSLADLELALPIRLYLGLQPLVRNHPTQA